MNRSAFALACGVALLVLYCPPVDAEDAVDCGDEPVNIDMSYGDIVNCEIEEPPDTDLFRFPGVINELIRIRVARVGMFESFQPCIDLTDPDGDIIAVGCNLAPFNEIQVKLDKTGRYVITVRDALTDGTGDYNLTVVRIAPVSSKAQPIEHGDNLAGDIGPVVDMDPYLLRGSEGDKVRVEIVRVGDFVAFQPCIELFDPEGNLVFKKCNLAPSNLIETRLPTKGDYTILASDVLSDGFGEFRLGLQCVTGPCVPAPRCAGKKATLVGTSGDNVITGTSGRDVIFAGAGNDTVYGLGGKDIICGGSGDDTLYGGSSGDNLRGNSGNDIVVGNGGNDVMRGGSGNDVLLGEAGNDSLRGQNGNDSLAGGEGDDRLNGGPGHDVCDGNAGVDSDGGQCEQLVNVP